jgi:hypothetical protein
MRIKPHVAFGFAASFIIPLPSFDARPFAISLACFRSKPSARMAMPSGFANARQRSTETLNSIHTSAAGTHPVSAAECCGQQIPYRIVDFSSCLGFGRGAPKVFGQRDWLALGLIVCGLGPKLFNVAGQSRGVEPLDFDWPKTPVFVVNQILCIVGAAGRDELAGDALASAAVGWAGSVILL